MVVKNVWEIEESCIRIVKEGRSEDLRCGYWSPLCQNLQNSLNWEKPLGFEQRRGEASECWRERPCRSYAGPGGLLDVFRWENDTQCVLTALDQWRSEWGQTCRKEFKCSFHFWQEKLMSRDWPVNGDVREQSRHRKAGARSQFQMLSWHLSVYVE